MGFKIIDSAFHFPKINWVYYLTDDNRLVQYRMDERICKCNQLLFNLIPKDKSSVDLSRKPSNDGSSGEKSQGEILYKRIVKLDGNLLLVPNKKASKNTPYLLAEISKEEPGTPFVTEVPRNLIPDFDFEFNASKSLLIQTSPIAKSKGLFFLKRDLSSENRISYEITELKLLTMLVNQVDFEQFLLTRETPEKTQYVDLILKYKWLVYIAVFILMLGINHIIRKFQSNKVTVDDDEEFETLDERLKREKKEKQRKLMEKVQSLTAQVENLKLDASMESVIGTVNSEINKKLKNAADLVRQRTGQPVKEFSDDSDSGEQQLNHRTTNRPRQAAYQREEEAYKRFVNNDGRKKVNFLDEDSSD